MGYIPDFEQVQWRHAPELAYDPSLPESFTAVMAGWLGACAPHTGNVSAEIMENLQWAYENRTIDQGWLGEHECEICHDHTDRGEILIADGDTMYVAPKMILHYIKVHSYLPPRAFLDAVGNIRIS